MNFFYFIWCVCVCLCVCVRARMCACMHACVQACENHYVLEQFSTENIQVIDIQTLTSAQNQKSEKKLFSNDSYLFLLYIFTVCCLIFNPVGWKKRRKKKKEGNNHREKWEGGKNTIPMITKWTAEKLRTHAIWKITQTRNVPTLNNKNGKVQITYQ